MKLLQNVGSKNIFLEKHINMLSEEKSILLVV